MGRCLLQRLLVLVATLQVLVAQGPSVSGLLPQVKGGVLQGGMRQVGPPGNSIIIQAHPGAADRDDVVRETPTLPWRNPATGGVGVGMEQEAGASHHSSTLQLLEQDTNSSHSTSTVDTGGTAGGGYEELASRMVTSGTGGTEQESADGGEAGSRSSHHLHRNVATPKAPRRRPGRSPGAPPPLQGADGGSSTPILPSHTPPMEDGDMTARSAPKQYNNQGSTTATTNNNVGITTTVFTPPPPPEDTLRPAHDVVVIPEVNVHDSPTETYLELAADVDTSRLSSSSSEDEDEDKDESIILVGPTLAPSTRHYYTFPPRLRPNLAYFGFIVYDTTPGYHGNTDHAHQRLQGKDTAVWIAILSVACFLAGIMITTIVCYAVCRRKWRPTGNQHLEDDLPPSDDLDDLRYSSENIDDPDTGVASGDGSSGICRNGSTEQLLPVVAGSTDLELLTCSQTNLLHCDFLNDDYHDCHPGGGQIHLHRHSIALEQQGEGAGDGSDHSGSQRRSSRGGSTSTCSRSSCSTCSTVLTLDSPGLAEEGGVRRPSNGSATGGDFPGVVSWGQCPSRHSSVSTDNGYFTPGGSSLVDWTSET